MSSLSLFCKNVSEFVCVLVKKKLSQLHFKLLMAYTCQRWLVVMWCSVTRWRQRCGSTESIQHAWIRGHQPGHCHLAGVL